MISAIDFIQHLKDDYNVIKAAPLDAYILQQIAYEFDNTLDYLSTSDSVIIKLRELTSALFYQVYPLLEGKDKSA